MLLFDPGVVLLYAQDRLRAFLVREEAGVERTVRKQEVHRNTIYDCHAPGQDYIGRSIRSVL